MADPFVNVATDLAADPSQDPHEISENVKSIAGIASNEVLGISKGASTEQAAAGLASSATQPIMGIAGARIETAAQVPKGDVVGTKSRLHPVSPGATDYDSKKEIFG